MRKKNVESQFEYQRQLIEWMTSLDERNPIEAPVAQKLTPESIGRLEVYQTSYLGRITATLSETIFEPCENLFGQELVAQLLAAYFKWNPPSEPLLTEAPRDFVRTLRDRATTHEASLFADMAELCQKHWNLLIGPDPSPRLPHAASDLSQVQLLETSAFMAASAVHDLALAWSLSRDKHFPNSLPSELFNKRKAILLVKVSAFELCAMGVPDSLGELVRALVQGKSLHSAILELEQHLSKQPENLADVLQEFIAQLSQNRCLELISLQS